MDAELGQALVGARRLLFLCSGNMVRSAFAELYARHLGCPIPAGSAATIYRNDCILSETARALHARGVSAAWTESFAPRHLEDVLPELESRTVVLAMARMHLEPLKRHPLERRAFLLARAIDEPLEILDPVLDGADFEQTFALVAECVEALVRHLKPPRRV